jgi:hypothetical protein
MGKRKVLKTQDEPLVDKKKGVWVYSGEAAGDVAGAVRVVRKIRNAWLAASASARPRR